MEYLEKYQLILKKKNSKARSKLDSIDHIYLPCPLTMLQTHDIKLENLKI